MQVKSHSLPTPKLTLSIKRKLVPPVPDSQSSPKLRSKLSSALHAIQKAKEDNAENDSDDDEFPPIIFRVNKDETEQAVPSTSSGYTQKSSRSAHTDLVSKQKNQPGDDEWLPGADNVTESIAPPLVKLGGVQSSNAEGNGVDKEETRHFTVSSYEEAELLVTELVPYEYSWDWIYIYIYTGFENNCG